MKCVFVIICFYLNLSLHAALWQVGPTRTYTVPSQVATLVGNGDTVDIDAGIYLGDVAQWNAHNLLLRGVGGYAHINANGNAYGGKAIWVISGNNTTVEFIQFSHCSVPDMNGAGIRQEGSNLTVRHCYFHNNENGILAGTVNPSNIIIEYSEFNANGYGDGYSHNVYVNHVDTLIFRYNYSHHTPIGHELKSRAHVNIITYNRISNEATGTASRCIDLPNGGRAYIIGNIIEQGPQAPNSNLISFGLEGLTNTTPHQLYLINNTLINNRSYGRFLQMNTGVNMLKAYNNIFAGIGIVSTDGFFPINTDTASNVVTQDISSLNFQNPTGYDFSLTAASTPCINTATQPGMANSLNLMPLMEYLHPHNAMPRCVDGATDVGAFEICFTAINQTHAVESLVYPNPASDVLIVENKSGISSIFIYDIIGRELFYDYYEVPDNKKEVFISDFIRSSGIVLVKVTDRFGVSSMHKINRIH